jgi:hypothetical protein
VFANALLIGERTRHGDLLGTAVYKCEAKLVGVDDGSFLGSAQRRRSGLISAVNLAWLPLQQAMSSALSAPPLVRYPHPCGMCLTRWNT